MARKYVNIKDFENKEFSILKEIGFTTISGGVVVFHNNKIGLDQLEIMKKNVRILSSWVHIKNSQKINMDHMNKYQAFVWIKLIKRTDKVSLKDLINVFTALVNIQNNREYKNKYSLLFCERINTIQGLSEDWIDRFLRTVTGL